MLYCQQIAGICIEAVRLIELTLPTVPNSHGLWVFYSVDLKTGTVNLVQGICRNFINHILQFLQTFLHF